MIDSKWCGGCDRLRPISEFNRNASKPDGYQHRCKTCASDYYERNKDRIRYTIAARIQSAEGRRVQFEQNLRKNFGISVHEFAIMWDRQEGACAICRQAFGDRKVDRPHVDHDHATGEVRGLLCHGCNTGLGNFRERIESLTRAIAYLGK